MGINEDDTADTCYEPTGKNGGYCGAPIGECGHTLRPRPCPDCEQTPCKCAEWERGFQAAQAEEAEREADFAETLLPYLWVEGLDGLLRRK